MLHASGLGGLGQTIAIMDQSGKVMTTSRHLMNIFSDAKQAYRERKTELQAARNAQPNSPRPSAPRRSHTIDEQSVASSRRSHRHHHHHRHHDDSKSRTSSHRRHSSSPSRRQSYHAGASGARESGMESPHHSKSPHPRSPGIDSPKSPLASPGVASPRSPFPPSPGAAAVPPSLVGHEAEMSMMRRASMPVVPKRRLSAQDIDPDLAYGDIPPNLFEQDRQDEAALKGLVGRARGLLDEAQCLQHGVTQTVQKLQRDPDAMAAVALTLAEISNLLKKMAPGAILQVRRMAPAVFAILSSPQFLVAVGVGVGVTIVALGGYKIVRRIQEKRAAEDEAEEMIQIRADVSRIETWRRGVAESDAGSLDTSVEGEFISPTAARLKALNLNDEKPKEKTRSRRARASTVHTKSVRVTRGASVAGSSAKSGSSSRSKSSRGKAGTSKDESARRRKHRSSSVSEAKSKPSPLRLMFGPS